MLLDKISLFSELSEPEIDAVTKLAVTRNFPKNTMILCEGDQSDSLYVVLTGKVRVFLSDEEGK